MASLPIPLPLAIPTAAAALAYFNASLAISYDWDLLSTYVNTTIGQYVSEYCDRVNLFTILEAHALSRKRASHTFLIHDGRQWTYKQAYDIILKYGTWLKTSMGVQKNEIVAMDFLNSEAFIWIWLGLWSLGAKPAFINYNLTGKPLLHTIRTSTTRLLLVDAEVRKQLSEEVMAELGNNEFRGEGKGSVEVIYFDKELAAHTEAGEGIREPDEARSGQRLHDMAMLIYTSGTTGLPKPAVVSWQKVSLGGRFVHGWLPLRKSDIMYTCMPLYHSSASILGLCSTLSAGSTIALGRRFSNHTFWPDVLASQATIIHYVGETCRYLLAAPPSPHDRQHNVRLAFGNGLRPDVWNGFKERFNIPMICEFYAATEGPSGLWNRSVNGFSAGAIGRNGTLAALFMGPQLAMVKMDPDSEPPAPLRDPATGLCKIADWNEPGELLYKLDPKAIERKFQGYFGNHSATSSKILRNVKKKGDAYFSTGDILRWDREGRWYFVDRIGDTFRWKAENVSTAEVSDVVGMHEAVREANVYGVIVPGHDGRAGCAAVVLEAHAVASSPSKSSSSPSSSSSSSSLETEKEGSPKPHPPEPHPHAHTHILHSLAHHLSSNLPRFAVPQFLRLTRNMHMTGTNKHQKHIFQQDGIDVVKVEQSGDVMYWLRGGVYERFGAEHLAEIRSGRVKL
ncbi:acetyl-CoA synthetase-like protein [Lepidopterella palustris CBS 459.81]|uniref:Very long-chain fatty acid transport protein n=1 Tax=Lepidopterella palustris CBS 459.81 TaxID=1314670 RepID=A0A8E2JKR7_9PEZI|nr:acetyl-CoA synthetase-like protein [Lepidopterella palustris CBS 459.81]